MHISEISGNNGKPRSGALRIESLDCLRGLIMVFMALDHARTFAFDVSFDLLDLKRTTFFLFILRWMANFGAPLFIFLAGTSAFLLKRRGKTKAELSEYLFIRGMILITLELVYFSRILTMSTHTILLQVMWVLGLSMIILSVLVWFPEWVILIYGIVLVVGHNLLDGVMVEATSPYYFFWSILHHACQKIQITPTLNFRVLYPLIPWTGVMALGYVFGRVLLVEKEKRIRIMYWSGAALFLAFIVIRMVNAYGDPHPWYVRWSFIGTFLTFINCTKYPPSFIFLLMTLGPGLILMGYFEKRIPRICIPFMVFGRVPFFYYIIHFPMLLFVMAVGGVAIKGVSISNMAMDNLKGGFFYILFIWIASVIALYPLCRWYCDKKTEKNWKWMRYF